MATKKKMLTAVFRDRLAASRTYDWLQALGYSSKEINALMTQQTRTLITKDEREGKIKAGNMAGEGMAAGGAVGTVVGATIGAIAAIGTAIALPGLGLVVAGPIGAALAGGGAGAVAGGLIGGLVGLGIPESNAKAYEKVLREGGIVIGVVPHSDEDATSIRKQFEEQGAENIVYA
jgi:hypothetical protein